MTASEVTTRDVAPKARQLPSLPVDVLALPGVFLWGEINVAHTVVDFDDALERYRGYQLGYESMLQLRQFFLGGGRKAILNRTVHINTTTGVPVSAAKASSTAQTGATSPSAASVTGSVVGPFALTAGDTLIGNVEGAGNQTATFNATAASLECANAEVYALADGQTLTVKIDGEATAQTITFNTAEFADIGNATAEEVAAVINAEIVSASAYTSTSDTKVTIKSDKEGTDSEVEVTGGTANTALGFSTTAVSGTGNVTDILAVTVSEIETIVEAAWTNGSGVSVTSAAGAVKIETNLTGATATLIVDASSTADDELGLDNATHTGGTGAAVNTLKIWGKWEGGTIGNALSYDVTAATNGNAEYFNLLVYLSGTLEKTWANCTMDSTSDDYVETKINTLSNLIEAEDLSAAGTATERRPANVTGAQLSGGDDGLALLDDNDFIGTQATNTGLYAFNLVNEGDVMICPDRATTALQNAAASYCETDKKNTVIFIPDPPSGLDADGAVTHVESLTASEQATGLPWPRVKITNPDKSVFGSADTKEIGPSGSIAARIARNTRLYETHVFTQPGNEIFGRLENVVDVADATIKDISVRRKVTPARINPIFAGKDTAGAYGVWLDDVQGLKGTGNFKSIGEIHGMALIRKTIMAYLDTVRTTPNTEENRLEDQRKIEAYLETWAFRGVFATNDASEAFYVNTDPEGVGINNPVVQEAEEYKVLVAVATARARRFIEVLFTRDQRAIENYIQEQVTSP